MEESEYLVVNITGVAVITRGWFSFDIVTAQVSCAPK